MTRDEYTRVQRIKQYVLARLQDELATAPRGAQAQLAKKLGVSGAHLSNMLSSSASRQPGEDFRRKAAAHWAISYAELEALALGEDPPASSLKPILRSEPPLMPNLAAALVDYKWMEELPDELRPVIRDQARQYDRVCGSEFSVVAWRRVVTGLEREALGFVAWRREFKDPKRSAARPSRRRRG